VQTETSVISSGTNLCKLSAVKVGLLSQVYLLLLFMLISRITAPEQSVEGAHSLKMARRIFEI